MLASDKHRDIYLHLWNWTSDIPDDTKPPVQAGYTEDLVVQGGKNAVILKGAAALFTRDRGTREDPRIWVWRQRCPNLRTQPDLDGADLDELISLAHERGHERSWREDTYPKKPPTMREERRAWEHAKKLLDSRGFKDWDDFEDHKERSLALHRQLGTPE